MINSSWDTRPRRYTPSLTSPFLKTDSHASPRFGEAHLVESFVNAVGTSAGWQGGKLLFLVALAGVGGVLTLGAVAIGATGQAVSKTFFSKNGIIDTVANADYGDDFEGAFIAQNTLASK